MRKKNLSVKVAALAMSGTLAMAPMTVRAAEVAAAPAASTEASLTGTEAANTPAAAPAATEGAETTATESSATAGVTTASGTGSTGSGATASAPAAGMATPAAVFPDVITNSDGSISLREPAVASNTTVENHVNDVVTDDKQGTDISVTLLGKNMNA